MAKRLISDKKGKFYIEKDGEIKAEMHYTKAGEKRLIIDHTEVDGDLRGQGAGKKMLLELVKYARENDFLIRPMCKYAKYEFQKDESIQDVLKK